MGRGRYGLLTVGLAGFGRAISEVGAVMIVGGNIDHLTRVMTTAIALETSKGDLELAMALGIILMLLALVVNLLLSFIRPAERVGKNQRRQVTEPKIADWLTQSYFLAQDNFYDDVLGEQAATDPAVIGGRALLQFLGQRSCCKDSIVMQSTTSTTVNSGLYDYLLPLFEEAYDIKVNVVAVGTGQAIRNAMREMATFCRFRRRIG